MQLYVVGMHSREDGTLVRRSTPPVTLGALFLLFFVGFFEGGHPPTHTHTPPKSI